MKKSVKYSINHDAWVFSLLNDDAYVKKHSAESYAITNFDTYEVDFKQTVFDLKTVIHELIHVHFKYCYTGSTKISNDEIEEIFCELFSDRSNLINKQAREIYQKLKRKRQT